MLWVDFDVEDYTIDLDDFAKALEKKPKIAAFGYASNLLGTVNPVKQMTQMAKAAGALVYIDAVQYAPHGPIDVQELGCDFLVCSSYKYYRTQFTRGIQVHRPSRDRKEQKVTQKLRKPKWVMGYNQRRSPISFSEFIQ